MNKLICQNLRLSRLRGRASRRARRHALGFVFWPNSPRRITVETVRAMTANVPAGVLKVGVFVDQPVADVARTMDEAGLDVAQLHGRESPEYCRQLMVALSGFAPSPRRWQGSPELAGGRPTADSRAVFKPSRSPTTARQPSPISIVTSCCSSTRTIPARSVERANRQLGLCARNRRATLLTILRADSTAGQHKLAIRSVRPYGVDVSSVRRIAPREGSRSLANVFRGIE